MIPLDPHISLQSLNVCMIQLGREVTGCGRLPSLARKSVFSLPNSWQISWVEVKSYHRSYGLPVLVTRWEPSTCNCRTSLSQRGGMQRQEGMQMSTWSTRRWKQRLWPPPVSREADPKDDYDAEEDIAVACRSMP